MPGRLAAAMLAAALALSPAAFSATKTTPKKKSAATKKSAAKKTTAKTPPAKKGASTSPEKNEAAKPGAKSAAKPETAVGGKAADTPSTVPAGTKVTGKSGKVFLWAESSANVERLGTTTGVVTVLTRMKETGIDSLVLEVKPVHGYVIYPSKVAPRLEKWKGYQLDPGFDVISTTLREARSRGIRVYLALNVFTEGMMRNPDTGTTFGVVFDPAKRDWEAWNYALPEQAPARGTTETATVRRISDQGKSFAVFVSPHNPAVKDYEIAVIRELAQYKPDGIILDRVRFNNIESDFSPAARTAFEKHLGKPVAHWPEDIVTWERGPEGKPKHPPGPLYDEWLYFRAKTINEFFARAREEVKKIDPKIEFGDYTGSWYGDYWSEGANWGSSDYDAARDYAWAPRNWKDAGYAKLLDVYMSGFYFKRVTIAEAQAAGEPAANSVEGAADLALKVTLHQNRLVGTLNLPDYRDAPRKFVEAGIMCLKKADGVMIFDLVYLDEYGWWSLARQITGARKQG